MKFDKRKDVSPKYLLLALTILCVGFILLSYFTGFSTTIKNQIVQVMAPIQKGINTIGIWTDSKLENLKEIEALNKENEALRAELENYKTQATMYQNRLDELASLQSLFKLDELYPDYNKTGAHVFAKDNSSWFSIFYIDKGTNDGVFVGANILCGEGLCGRVTECYGDYSKVIAIIDDSSEISARVMPSNALCTVVGNLTQYENGYLIVKSIDKDASVNIGDKVITSSISERFHPGITIGYVSEITNDSNNLTKTAYITPVVDFDNISEVLIITDQKMSITDN